MENHNCKQLIINFNFNLPDKINKLDVVILEIVKKIQELTQEIKSIPTS